jgi:hypothetical protein
VKGSPLTVLCSVRCRDYVVGFGQQTGLAAADWHDFPGVYGCTVSHAVHFRTSALRCRRLFACVADILLRAAAGSLPGVPVPWGSERDRVLESWDVCADAVGPFLVLLGARRLFSGEDGLQLIMCGLGGSRREFAALSVGLELAARAQLAAQCSALHSVVSWFGGL